MSGLASSGFAELDRLADLFRRTRRLLDATLETGALPAGGRDVLATETLPHIEGVEQGFRGALRAAGTDLDELRRLVSRGGLGLSAPRDRAEARAALIETMQVLGREAGHRLVRPVPAADLAALEHARLALAMLPGTPSEEVHFPGARTYADIPLPRGPGEFADRMEEIERMLWLVALGQVRSSGSTPRWRRVYGFFDAGERLSVAGLGA